MIIRVNNQVDEKKWLSLLADGHFSSPFQTPEFFHLYNRIDGFHADVFAIEINENYSSLVVVTLQKEKGVKSFFSRRGIIYGGPLLIEYKNNYVDELFSYLNRFYKRKLIYLESRNYFDYSRYLGLIEKNRWKYKSWINFQKDISTEIIAKSTVSDSRLRQVKKALKNGVEWRIAQNIEEVKSFYLILKELYQYKIKKPLFPFPFFKEFYESHLGVYLLVYFEGKVIGGIMCPEMPNKSIYEFYVCGLDNEYKDQYPSVMATWAAIEYGIKKNIPLFDFMGAGSPAEEYGVREFKSRFGGKLVEHGRFLKVFNPILYSIGKLGLKILSKF